MRNARRFGPALAGAILAVLLASCATSSSTPTATSSATVTTHPLRQSDEFAGCQTFASTRSINARWAVPAIAPSSPTGDAGTWIGAQGDDGGAWFIQVGTTESTTGPNGAVTYAAFWSDTTVNTAPQSFLDVHAGDQVAASMTQTSSGWAIRFDDQTTGASKQLSIPYAPAKRFNLGEWIQEDPLEGSTGNTKSPYPTIAPTRFEGIRRNGAVPTSLDVHGQVLTTADGWVVTPTPLVGGSFGFTTART